MAAFTFGSTAHAAFEAFTKERRERAARGEPPPTRDDLAQHFRRRWKPTGFPDKVSEDTYRRRVGTLLDNFWTGEVAGAGEALHEELKFELRLEPADGSPVVGIVGSIDRVDGLPSGGIEVLDYKTGRCRARRASTRACSCRSTPSPAATPSVSGRRRRSRSTSPRAAIRMSTTRTDEQLDAARDDLLSRAAADPLGRLPGDTRRRSAAGATTGRSARAGRD